MFIIDKNIRFLETRYHNMKLKLLVIFPTKLCHKMNLSMKHKEISILLRTFNSSASIEPLLSESYWCQSWKRTKIRIKIRQKAVENRYANVLYLKSREIRIILFKSHNFYCVPNWRLCKSYFKHKKNREDKSKWCNITLY